MTSVISTPLIPETAKSETRIQSRLAKGTSIYTIGTVFSKLLQLAIQVLLARQLQLSGYGLYNLGFNTMYLLTVMAILGLDQSVLRYGAMYRSRGQMESVKGTILGSLMIGTASSLMATAVLIFFASSLAIHLFNEPGLAPTLKIFALGLPFFVVARITGAFAQSHHDILRMTAIQQISQPGLNLLLVFFLFLLGGGLRWAACAFVFSTAFSAGVGVYSLRAVFPDCFSFSPAHFHYTELLRYSLTLSAIAILYQLSYRVPTLLIGNLAGAQEVGLFSAAATLAAPSGVISSVFAQPLMPMMVDLYEQRNFKGLDLLYRTVARWTSMVVIPAFGFLMLFRKQFLAMFGPDYAGAGDILIPLGVAWMIYYAKGPVDSLLDMTGRQFVDLANLAGVLALSFGLGVWLIPRSGAVGAGWAIAISILAWTLAEIIEAWILFRIPPFSKHFVQVALIAGVAFGTGIAIRNHVSAAAEAMCIGSLYMLFTAAFGFTTEDKFLLGRGIRKLTLFFG